MSTPSIEDVLRTHRINFHHRNVGPQPVAADNLRYTSCDGCDWLGGHHDEAGWEAHVADAIRAHLADVAGRDEVREDIHAHVCMVPGDVPDIFHVADAAVHAYLQAIGDQP